MSNTNHSTQRKAVTVEPLQKMMRMDNVDPNMIQPSSDSRMIQEIPIDQIQPSPYQARSKFDQEELAGLAASIKEHGIIQPVTVVERQGDGRASYELVFGERRWRAGQLAGLEVIPARVVPPEEITKEKQSILGLIENLQRTDLNPMEIQSGLEQLKESSGYSWKQIASLLGISERNLRRFRSLGALPADVQEMVRTGELNLHQASTLIGLQKTQAQTELARIAVTDNLPGDALKEIVKSIQTGEKVETAVVGSTRRRTAKKARPVVSDGSEVAPPDEENLMLVEENTTGMSILHRGIMKDLPEQQSEDLAFQIKAHDLNVPVTRIAVNIMLYDSNISASAAVAYAQFLARRHKAKLFDPLQKTELFLDQLEPPLHGKLGRGSRTAVLATLEAMDEKLATLLELVRKQDRQAKTQE